MPPLAGLRVIDLTRVVAGPYCTMMLGDMGAEVLKIEEPNHGDDSRGWGPFINGWSSFFLQLNRSKKSVTIDLKTKDGAQTLRRLIETADVLIENFRPGSLAELGFDYASASALNPRLIYCSISGFGQAGPHAHLPGYDAVIQGNRHHGHDRVSRRRADARRRRDHRLSRRLYAMGILLALRDRDRSGKGQHVDIALFDAMLSVMRLPLGVLLATGTNPSRVGNDHLSIAPYESLRAKDGYIIVAVANPRLWNRFCAAIERRELVDDPRFRTNSDRVAHRHVLKQELEAQFAALTVDEITTRLQAQSVPCGRVRSMREAIEHPQVKARDILLAQHGRN
jgi:CoA:oxalate CoA-transferase